MQNIKLIFIGILIGVVITAVAGGYFYFTQPKPAQARLTQEQKWANEHPDEMHWTISRYQKFQEAAHSSFLEEDIAGISAVKK